MANTKQLSDCLHRLSRSLTHLDRHAVESCTAELEQLRSEYPAEWLAGTDLAVLLFQVREASELTGAASGLYSGWVRMAAPPPLAYTPDGAHPTCPVPTGTVAVQA